jgi:hypothetical protein
VGTPPRCVPAHDNPCIRFVSSPRSFPSSAIGP